MRTARFAAAVGAAALVLLGVTACDGTGGGGGSAAPDGGAAATSELNGIQSTLDSIGSDMAGDGSP